MRKLIFILSALALGGLAFAKPSVPEDREGFREYIRELHKRSASGDFSARDEIRRLRIEGHGYKDDYVNVYELMDLAERRDDPELHFAVASALYHGRGGFEVDHEKAREGYERAASMGHRSGAFNLGLMLLTGEGGEKDFDAAYDKFSLARGMGHAQALFEMGIVRCEQRRYQEAIDILEHAPLDGEPWNLFFLANAYRGLPPKPELRRKAFELYSRASDQGILMAHIHSAAMMVDGDEGVDPDPDRALVYLNRMLESDVEWSFYVFRNKYLIEDPAETEPELPRGKSRGVGRGRDHLARATIARDYRLKSKIRHLIEASDKTEEIDALVENINRRAEEDLRRYLRRKAAEDQR